MGDGAGTCGAPLRGGTQPPLKIQADAFLTNPPESVVSAPAILAAGNESYLIDKALAALIERVVTVPGSESFDLETRDATDLDAAGFDALASTPPLLNDRRIVILKNVSAVSPELREAVKNVLAAAPKSLCLIGTGPATMRGNLYAEWEKQGARIVCELPRRSSRSSQVDFDYARWLTARARADFGKRLDREAARALEATGGDLAALYQELEKVALYVGSAEQITSADVEAICTGGTICTVWQWCDAVGAGDLNRALELLRQLLAAGESAYRLIPLLATHFCRLGIVVELGTTDAGAIQSALPGRSWPSMARSLASQARRHTPRTVAHALDRLAEADRMLKSTSHSEEFVIQTHLIEILRAA